MRVVTIRDAIGTLICFGPTGGMYEPTFNAALHHRTVEPEYESVRAEWKASTLPTMSKQSMIFDNPAVPQWFKDYIR